MTIIESDAESVADILGGFEGESFTYCPLRNGTPFCIHTENGEIVWVNPDFGKHLGPGEAIYIHRKAFNGVEKAMRKVFGLNS